MDPKYETLMTYEVHAAAFDQEFGEHMRRYNLPHAQAFLQALPARGRILDIGSGPGHYAEFFAAHGFDVLCGDFSPAMVERCRGRGLPAERMDLETFELGRRFDGVWANACLLHLAKAKVPAALERLARHLEPAGVFACAVKEGEDEGLKADPDYGEARRFFSYFRDDEFRARLERRFRVVRYERTPSASGKTVFLKYLCRLKEA